MADVVKPALDALLVAAYDALDLKPGRACVLPGANVAWDDCCDGQLYVRLVSVVPQNTTPRTRGVSSTNACGIHLWDVTIALGMIRCAATVDDSGEAPSCDVLDTEAAQLITDMLALQRVLVSPPEGSTVKTMPERYTPLGPQGGCAGGEWTAHLTVPNC